MDAMMSTRNHRISNIFPGEENRLVVGAIHDDYPVGYDEVLRYNRLPHVDKALKLFLEVSDLNSVSKRMRLARARRGLSTLGLI